MLPSKLIKTLLVIACILAFSVLTLVLVRRPALSSQPFAKEADAAKRIIWQMGEVKIQLEKNETAWKVALSGGPSYRANSEKVKSLLNGLKNVFVEDVISERAESAAEFDLNSGSATAITLFDDKATLASGLFGKQAPDFSHIYFKFADKPAIYLARGVIRGELGQADLKSWRDRTLLNFSEDQALTVMIEGPGFKTGLARSSDTWTCNGKLIDSTHVWGMLGQLAHAQAEDFVDPAQHPDVRPEVLRYASVSVQTREGAVQTLHLGKPDTQTKRYPAASDQHPDIAWVAEPTVLSILQKPTDFQPPAKR